MLSHSDQNKVSKKIIYFFYFLGINPDVVNLGIMERVAVLNVDSVQECQLAVKVQLVNKLNIGSRSMLTS